MIRVAFSTDRRSTGNAIHAMTDLKTFAREADDQDPLARFRAEFHFPETDAEHCIYLTGNSLGLQPKRASQILNEELEDWAKFGVEGHFHARRPWVSYHERLIPAAADIVGAKPIEVVHMNGLTTDIHLLMVSFYRPNPKRYKILCEAKAFPSDQYALDSQISFHGYDPDDALIELSPRDGEHTIREEDIEAAIKEHGDELALVFFGGVNYYTGQVFDMKRIARAGHEVGAVVGFDLAHAAGNIPLQLHDWQIDFAAWCTYKYLNSGPGSVGGVFVHEKHADRFDLPRFAGWWGSDKASRFEMKREFQPLRGAEGWQLSNAPVFSMAPHLASLELFAEAGMDDLQRKSVALSKFARQVIAAAARAAEANVEIITPSEPARHGCQLSLLVHDCGREVFDYLQNNGAFVDWREPNVIRIAPVPLYNSFTDVYRFGQLLERAIKPGG